MVTLPIDEVRVSASPDLRQRTIEASFRCTIGEEMKAELAGLIGLGNDQLEIVVRRRTLRPQDIQSVAEPAVVDLPWNGPSKKVKAKVSTDVPQTQPDWSEEPTTAQLVEEFGSWG